MTRGGKRAGAGRKPLSERGKRIPQSLSLSQEVVCRLQEMKNHSLPPESVSIIAEKLLRRALSGQVYKKIRPDPNEHTLYVLNCFLPIFNALLKHWKYFRNGVDPDSRLDYSLLFETIVTYWPEAKNYVPLENREGAGRRVLRALLTGIELIKIAILDQNERPRSVPPDILDHYYRVLHNNSRINSAKQVEFNYYWMNRQDTHIQMEIHSFFEDGPSKAFSNIFFEKCVYHIAYAFAQDSEALSNGALWVRICPICGRLFKREDVRRIYHNRTCLTNASGAPRNSKISHFSHAFGRTWREFEDDWNSY